MEGGGRAASFSGSMVVMHDDWCDLDDDYFVIFGEHPDHPDLKATQTETD